MRATVPYIQEKFGEFNRLCFAGKLPEVPVELSNAKGYLGKCLYKRRRKLNGSFEYYDFRLRISTRLDLPEQEVEDTIIHEMIHYYILYNHIEDTSAHGRVFRQMMDSINGQYGRHITISHRTTPEQAEEAAGSKARWHVVAVVGMKDGRTGIKVIPRIVQRIRAYRRGILGSPEVRTAEFFLSNDPFFNRYPNSAALRVYFIDPAELEPHLKDARRITVRWNKVVVS